MPAFAATRCQSASSPRRRAGPGVPDAGVGGVAAGRPLDRAPTPGARRRRAPSPAPGAARTRRAPRRGRRARLHRHGHVVELRAVSRCARAGAAARAGRCAGGAGNDAPATWTRNVPGRLVGVLALAAATAGRERGQQGEDERSVSCAAATIPGRGLGTSRRVPALPVPDRPGPRRRRAAAAARPRRRARSPRRSWTTPRSASAIGAEEDPTESGCAASSPVSRACAPAASSSG